MGRAIVRHVRWDIHPTGTCRPPPSAETNDNYTEEEEEKEEGEVSDLHSTLYFYMVLGGDTPTREGEMRPLKPLVQRQNCVGILP